MRKLLVLFTFLILVSVAQADVTITLKIGAAEATRVLTDLEVKRMQCYYEFLNFKDWQRDPDNFVALTAVQRFKQEVNGLIDMAIKRGAHHSNIQSKDDSTATQETRADTKKAEFISNYSE